jgi:filamentous hemagglutinin
VLGTDGRLLRVHGLRAGSARARTAYNLEVADIHTYQVGASGVLVHNACSTGGAGAAPDGVGLSLRYKSGWNAAQRSAADEKVGALNDAASSGGLRVTAVQRSGTSASSRYRSAGGTVPRGADVDHTIDLQLGGLDDVANMSPLERSVNRSLGSQIMWQLKSVEPGTCVTSVTIC